MSLLEGVANPFRRSIVTDPWSVDDVDVPGIHADVYGDCLQTVAQVRQSGASTSLLVHGDPGAGKTHLLSRLRRHFAASINDDTQPQSLFSWIRLNTGHQMVWRHVRRRLVEDLLRPAGTPRPISAGGPLPALVRNRLFELWPSQGNRDLWWDFAHEHRAAALEEVLSQLFDQSRVEFSVAQAIKALVLGGPVRAARAWLRGDPLTESVLATLEIREDWNDSSPEQLARETVLSLCRLIAACGSGAKAPVLTLGFDQVEALQVTHDDIAGMYAFGQLASTLHDETTCVALISCVQSGFAQELRDHVNGADRDRMQEFGARALPRLTPAEGESLILARLEQVPEIAARRPADSSHFWPLEPAQVRPLLEQAGLVARRLLSHCAEQFDRAGGETQLAIPTLHQFLENTWKQRVKDALELSPLQTETVLGTSLRYLILLTKTGWTERSVATLGTDDIAYDTPDGCLALCICEQTVMNSLTSRLKNLLANHENCGVKRLILLRDARTDITAGAKKARETLAAITALGHVLLRPDAGILAGLDAMRSLIGDARSGDLAYQGEPLATETVMDWIRQNEPPAIRDFAAQIHCGTPATAALA